MKKFLFLLVFYAFSASLFANPKIDPYLQQKMNEAGDNNKLPVYIVFDKHLSLNDFNDISYDTPRQERRKIVIERLMNFSAQYQQSVRQYLNTEASRGNAENYTVLWIANSIIINAQRNVIEQLAADYPNIAMIAYDAQYDPSMLVDGIQASAPFTGAAVTSAAIEPGITLMNADDCWNLGNTGQGVVVANADDGFYWKHPDLVHGIYQNLGEDANNNGMTIIFGSGTTSTIDPGDINGVDDDGNGLVDDVIGWDFTANNYNIGLMQHGSATLGHVIGDGTGGTQTGVAPGAKCLLMRNNSGQSQQWLAFQYALQMGADVVTSSLSFKWYFSPKPDYSMMRTVTDALLAAGIANTNSTSNDGTNQGQAPIPLNISASGNCPPPWRHPDQLKNGGYSAVIGVGDVNCLNDVIVSTSPYGPATWGNWDLWGTYTYTIDPNYKDYPYSRTAPVEVPDSMGLLKPDVSAPGDNSISTYVTSGTGYGTFGGTSSATPHTGGCVALMLSLNPELLPRDIDKILELTSIEKGAAGKDPRYGAGRIDALAATTSPKFTIAGISGPSNLYLNNTLAASDTARELAGLKISTTVNPQVGSLKSIEFSITTNATASQITSFDLYFDKDKNNVVSAGDIKLKSKPFSTGTVIFDTLKFKFLDSARTLIVAARTTASANNTHTVSFGIADTNKVTAYYTTKPFNTNFPFNSVVGITPNTEQVIDYSLSQNYPNPFNPSTIINYSVAKEGIVKIRVYDILGKEVAVIVNSNKLAGNYKVEFDTKDYANISSGIYYYKMESGDFTEVRKMILLK